MTLVASSCALVTSSNALVTGSSALATKKHIGSTLHVFHGHEGASILCRAVPSADVGVLKSEEHLLKT